MAFCSINKEQIQKYLKPVANIMAKGVSNEVVNYNNKTEIVFRGEPSLASKAAKEFKTFVEKNTGLKLSSITRTIDKGSKLFLNYDSYNDKLYRNNLKLKESKQNIFNQSTVKATVTQSDINKLFNENKTLANAVYEAMNFVNDSTIKLLQKYIKKINRILSTDRVEDQNRLNEGNFNLKYGFQFYRDIEDLRNGDFRLVPSTASKSGASGGNLFILELKNRGYGTAEATNYTPGYIVIGFNNRIRYIEVDKKYRRLGVASLLVNLYRNQYGNTGFSLINNKNIFKLTEKLGGIKVDETTTDIPALEKEITPQQKQEALQKFQDYVNATGKQDIEGFKEFVTKPALNKQELTQIFTDTFLTRQNLTENEIVDVELITEQDLQDSVQFSTVIFNSSQINQKFNLNNNEYYSITEIKPEDISKVEIGKEKTIRVNGRLTTDNYDILLFNNSDSLLEYNFIILSKLDSYSAENILFDRTNHLDKIQDVSEKLTGKVGVYNGNFITEKIVEINKNILKKTFTKYKRVESKKVLRGTKYLNDVIYINQDENKRNKYGNFVYTTDNEEYAKRFGSVQEVEINYIKPLIFNNDIEFYRDVNWLFGITSDRFPTKSMMQEYGDFMLNYYSVIEIKKEPETQYLTTKENAKVVNTNTIKDVDDTTYDVTCLIN